MTTHHLKTHPRPFEAQLQAHKTFEARLDDRNFQVGDVLVLREWDPALENYTGRAMARSVTYILRGTEFGIMPGWCVMATKHPALGAAHLRAGERSPSGE